MVAAPSPGSILHHPGGAGWSWERCGCHKDPCQTKFQFCRVPRMGGIKLQLLCGVRIELAVGSLPYPGESGFPIVSPGRDRPLSGFPICKPCLDVRQNPSRDTHFPSYGRRPLPKPKPKMQAMAVRIWFAYFGQVSWGYTTPESRPASKALPYQTLR